MFNRVQETQLMFGGVHGFTVALDVPCAIGFLFLDGLAYSSIRHVSPLGAENESRLPDTRAR